MVSHTGIEPARGGAAHFEGSSWLVAQGGSRIRPGHSSGHAVSGSMPRQSLTRVQGVFHPRRHKHGADVPALADQIGDDAVLLALLNPPKLECEEFAASQPAAKQHREHRVIAELARRRRCTDCEQPPRYRPGSLLTQVRQHRLHQEHALDGNECVG